MFCRLNATILFLLQVHIKMLPVAPTNAVQISLKEKYKFTGENTNFEPLSTDWHTTMLAILEMEVKKEFAGAVVSVLNNASMFICCPGCRH